MDLQCAMGSKDRCEIGDDVFSWSCCSHHRHLYRRSNSKFICLAWYWTFRATSGGHACNCFRDPRPLPALERRSPRYRRSCHGASHCERPDRAVSNAVRRPAVRIRPGGGESQGVMKVYSVRRSGALVHGRWPRCPDSAACPSGASRTPRPTGSGDGVSDSGTWVGTLLPKEGSHGRGRRLNAALDGKLHLEHLEVLLGLDVRGHRCRHRLLELLELAHPNS